MRPGPCAGNFMPDGHTSAAQGRRRTESHVTTMDKKETRAAIRRATSALGTDERRRQSLAVTARLQQIIGGERPAVTALFAPLPDEIDIGALIGTAPGRIVLPRVEPSEDGTARMEFYDFDPAAMARGAFGIDEPQGTVPCRPEEIDLMVVPGMAFTRGGLRLGRGKGYYDRYMSREGFRARRIGVCFIHQLLGTLPAEPHDRPMDEVITAAEQQMP